MLCKNPYMGPSGHAHGCGQCNPCRKNLRRKKTTRGLLEGFSHLDSCFLTATYNDDNLPFGVCHWPKIGKGLAYDGHLVKKDFQNFIKRLRDRVSPRRIRMFYCGEYGDKGRPHYHAILWGISPLELELIQACWTFGFVSLGTVTWDSLQYTMGYIVKRCTKRDDPRLGGKPPEFGHGSTKPGLGASYVPELTSALVSEPGSRFMVENKDVPRSFKLAGKELPLDRYLRSKIREQYGFEETGAQPGWEKKQKEEVRELLEKKGYSREVKIDKFQKKELLLEKYKQDVENLEYRMSIFKKKEIL